MSKSLYFLIYVDSGKKSELALREPTIDSKDFIRIKGKRVSKIFNSIMSVLDAYNLRFNISKSGNKIVVELPADIGYAILVYLLLVYNAREPKKWIYLLERLLAGKIPLSKYFNIFIDMAIDLSDLEYDRGSRKAVIKPSAARVVSSIMRVLIKNLQ